MRGSRDRESVRPGAPARDAPGTGSIGPEHLDEPVKIRDLGDTRGGREGLEAIDQPAPPPLVVILEQRGIHLQVRTHLDDLVEHEVALLAGRRPDAHGLIGEAYEGGVAVRLGIHGHGAYAHLAGGAHHAQGDLAAVGDEQLLDLLFCHGVKNGKKGRTLAGYSNFQRLPSL